MFKTDRKRSGSATVEYILILPLAMACVVAVIMIFMALYQKSAIQGLADTTAEGLSMVWKHNPVKAEELTTGAYSRESYDNRQIYWQILPVGSGRKAATAQEWAKKQLDTMGILKKAEDARAQAIVNYHHGFPSGRIEVSLSARYIMPGAAALRFIGLGDRLMVKGSAEYPIYDQKEMIHVTDYIVQKVMDSGIGELLKKLASPLKKVLKMLE